MPIIYTFSNVSNLNGEFRINQSDGKVTLLRPLDYEERKQFAIALAAQYGNLVSSRFSYIEHFIWAFDSTIWAFALTIWAFDSTFEHLTQQFGHLTQQFCTSRSKMRKFINNLSILSTCRKRRRCSTFTWSMLMTIHLNSRRIHLSFGYLATNYLFRPIGP